MLRWFPNLFGFEECQLAGGKLAEIQATRDRFLQTQANFKVLNDKQLQSLPNGRVFTMGVFATPTLHELRESAAALLSTELTRSTDTDTTSSRSNSCSSNQDNTRPRVTYEHLAITDILKMHHENPGATFQAASQFNCLEFGAPHVTPEYGVSSYAYDETQGPACALACAAGTIFRNYFVPVRAKDCSRNDNNASREEETEQREDLGQSERLQLNTLDELELLLHNKQQKYWNIHNGYSFADVDSLTRLNADLHHRWPGGSSQRDKLRAAVKVGVQVGVGVTFSRRFTPFSPEVRGNNQL